MRRRLALAILPALLAGGVPAAAQGSPQGFWKSLAASPTPQDVLLVLSSLEWGVPDRLSFTSRYIHMFDPAGEKLTHRNNFVASFSPGVDGVRAGLGWGGITYVGGAKGPGIMSEVRTVLLRTWDRPLIADPRTTYLGAEARISVTAVVSVTGGWYRRVTAAPGRPDHFWGLHVGVGM